MVRWVPTEEAKVGNSIGDWKVSETYATFRGEFVEAHAKEFKVFTGKLGTEE